MSDWFDEIQSLCAGFMDEGKRTTWYVLMVSSLSCLPALIHLIFSLYRTGITGGQLPSHQNPK